MGSVRFRQDRRQGELGPLLLQHRHRVGRRQPGAEPDDPVRLERPERRPPVHDERARQPRRQSAEWDDGDDRSGHQAQLHGQHQPLAGARALQGRRHAHRLHLQDRWQQLGRASSRTACTRSTRARCGSTIPAATASPGTAMTARRSSSMRSRRRPRSPAGPITQTVDGILAVDRAIDIDAEPADAEQLVGDDELPLQLGSRSRVRRRTRTRSGSTTTRSRPGRSRSSAPIARRWGIVVSPVLRHQSGDPLARVVQASRGVDLATGLTRNTNSTINYEAEQTGAYREDNITIFDARLEKRFRLSSVDTSCRSSSTRSTSRTRTRRRARTTPWAAGRPRSRPAKS